MTANELLSSYQKYNMNDKVKVRDPGDRRRWLEGTIIQVLHGAGAFELRIEVEFTYGVEIWRVDPEDVRHI